MPVIMLINLLYLDIINIKYDFKSIFLRNKIIY